MHGKNDKCDFYISMYLAKISNVRMNFDDFRYLKVLLFVGDKRD